MERIVTLIRHFPSHACGYKGYLSLISARAYFLTFLRVMMTVSANGNSPGTRMFLQILAHQLYVVVLSIISAL